ncbi:uncharacterized protein LOC131624081 [Vicia villosa]|uniref:uncharacterized protein LOC131624081 n=1 Tax=Vicia villosa TaxID=3911 RepID=UPI00273AD822|nr:uncharacterized protein LOC131624081 [Vicia villosa]
MNDQFNKAGNKSYTIGLNQSSDLTIEEFIASYTRFKASNKDSYSNARSNALVFNISDDDLPTNLDWREKGVVKEVKKQGGCGGYWAFVTVAAVDGFWSVTNGRLLDLSEQQVIDCDRGSNGCISGDIVSGLSSLILSAGIREEFEYPYKEESGTCKNDYMFETEAFITCYKIIQPNYEQNLLRVSYGISQEGVKHWRINNSWSKASGEIGYMRIKREGDGPEGHYSIATRPFIPCIDGSNALVFNISDDDLPTNLDWREKGVFKEVKQQGGCGGYWAFVTVAAVDGFWSVTNGRLLDLSEQQVIDCDRSSNGCISGDIVSGLSSLILSDGIREEFEYPYKEESGTCKNDYMFETEAIITCYKIIQPNYEQNLLRVSYGISQEGVKHWRIKNSWSKASGEIGYMRIKREGDGPEGHCSIATRPFIPCIDGFKASNKDSYSNARSNALVFNISDDDLPTNLDWREKGVVKEVKQQGGCGGYWAFVTVAAVDGFWSVTNGRLLDFQEGVKHWRIKNSWSKASGEIGYMRIKREGDGPEGHCSIATRPFIPCIDGFKASNKDSYSNARSNALVFNISDDDLPTNLDWREKGVVKEVKQQGGCGGYWAFVTVAAVDGFWSVTNGRLLDLSEQ